MERIILLLALICAALLVVPACNDSDENDSGNGSAQTTRNESGQGGPANAGSNDPPLTDAASDDSRAPISPAWTDAAVGDSVKIRIQGGPQPGKVFRTTTVKDVSRDTVVLEHEMQVDMPNMPGLGQLPSVPAGNKTIEEVDRNAQPWQQSAQGSPDVDRVPVKTGTESLTIDGKTVSTTVYQTQAPGVGEIKYWFSNDVPGRMVKMTTASGMTMEVVEFQKN